MRSRGSETHLFSLGLPVRRSALALYALAARLLAAHVLETRSPLLLLPYGARGLRLPLCPVVCALCARVPDGGEEVVCVVVAGDLGAGRVDGCEHEGIEVCVTPLESVLCYREVGRGEKVEEGEVGHAEVDGVDVVVVERHAVGDDDEQEGGVSAGAVDVTGRKMHMGIYLSEI